MRYKNPEQVVSPKVYINNVQVIHDGGEESVSIAKINWEGNDCIAMRWNVARREWENQQKVAETELCLGMPSSHGFPVWFILPNELFNKDSEIYKKIEKALK